MTENIERYNGIKEMSFSSVKIDELSELSMAAYIIKYNKISSDRQAIMLKGSSVQ